MPADILTFESGLTRGELERLDPRDLTDCDEQFLIAAILGPEIGRALDAIDRGELRGHSYQNVAYTELDAQLPTRPGVIY